MLQIDTSIPLSSYNGISESNIQRGKLCPNTIIRAEAIKLGLKTYFTGKPCNNGHMAHRFVSGRMCSECQKEKLKIYKASEQGKLNSKNNWLQNQYGISLDQYNELIKNQNNKCACCELELIEGKIHVDHCHNTNKICGVLCSKCNRAIGFLNHSSKILEKAARYCERTHERN
jgi:hypothetical protein